jgi:hypothetical protein
MPLKAVNEKPYGVTTQLELREDDLVGGETTQPAHGET